LKEKLSEMDWSLGSAELYIGNYYSKAKKIRYFNGIGIYPNNQGIISGIVSII